MLSVDRSVLVQPWPMFYSGATLSDLICNYVYILVEYILLYMLLF